jgi:two-component system, probable response regulator PhcQ
MEEHYDYKRFAILYVDDEEISLRAFARAFSDQFTILTASNAKDGFEILKARQDEIGVVMTDQRMPGEKGVWLLEKARQLQPRIIRIMVTAYSDMNAAVEAVNSGAIYKYLSKPWDPEQLELTLRRGLEFFIVQHERDKLLEERASVLHNMMVTDRMASLGILSATLSHHIRNSLVAVKTFLDMAPDNLRKEKTQAGDLLNPEFWSNYHKQVQDQLGKIHTLLRTLDAASSKLTTKFQEHVELRQVITRAIEKLSETPAAQRIQIQNHVPDSLPVMTVDGAKFPRIFELLFEDELLTLPAGSTLVVSAECCPNLSRPIKVRVQDNGPALPTESVLFDPLNLGGNRPLEYAINLMACYFIVHQHGGTVEVHSTPAGTTFTLNLPIDSNIAPPVEDPDLFQKILLADRIWRRLASE